MANLREKRMGARGDYEQRNVRIAVSDPILYFQRTVGGLESWFPEPRQYPTIEVLDKIVELLKRDGKDKDNEVFDLIFRKLNTTKRESNRDMLKWDLTSP